MNEKDLIRALKSERCPSRVLRRVRERVGNEKPGVAGLRWGLPLVVSAAAMGLALMIFIHLKDGPVPAEKIGTASITEPASIVPSENPAVSVRELEYTLAYIGLTVKEQMEKNSGVVVRKTVPVIRQSIEDTQKIINKNMRDRKLL
jgi:hypothetical protein